MANGDTTMAILDRIEAHILRLEQKIDSINTVGCALRPEHDRRLTQLEGTTAKVTGGLVVTMLAALGTMAAAIISHITTGK